MERIAFIIGETFIYWSSIILVFAAVTAVCLFLALYIGKSRNMEMNSKYTRLHQSLGRNFHNRRITSVFYHLS